MREKTIEFSRLSPTQPPLGEHDKGSGSLPSLQYHLPRSSGLEPPLPFSTPEGGLEKAAPMMDDIHKIK